MNFQRLILSAIIACVITPCWSKPKARFLGMKKGRVDKITFLAAQDLQLADNKDSLWEILSYEFNYSCNGAIVMKAYKSSKIPREILTMVKNCNQPTVADFRRIMGRNRKSGKIIQLNDIMLTVE